MLDTQSHLEAAALQDVATRNYHVLGRQLDGLTHADSLLQLPFRGNCLNWIVGHLTQSRDKMLQIVDAPSVWTPTQIARYARGSEPVTNGDDALPFEQILADLAAMHERLLDRLATITPDALSAPAKVVQRGIEGMSVGESLNFLLWHETYHLGQTELLRQLAGKNDKVI